MPFRINLRQLLNRAAAAGAGILVAPFAVPAFASADANEKLNLAFVGAGGRGSGISGGTSAAS